MPVIRLRNGGGTILLEPLEDPDDPSRSTKCCPELAKHLDLETVRMWISWRAFCSHFLRKQWRSHEIAVRTRNITNAKLHAVIINSNTGRSLDRRHSTPRGGLALLRLMADPHCPIYLLFSACSPFATSKRQGYMLRVTYIGAARGAQGAMPQIFLEHLVIFELEEAVSQTKYCCSPKTEHFATPRIFWSPSKSLGWLRRCAGTLCNYCTVTEKYRTRAPKNIAHVRQGWANSSTANALNYFHYRKSNLAFKQWNRLQTMQWPFKQWCVLVVFWLYFNDWRVSFLLVRTVANKPTTYEEMRNLHCKKTL